MNGQTSRLEATRQIIFELGIERMIETGTFRGATTEWFGELGIPVETVEVNERYYAFSKLRLARLKHVSVIKNSSVTFLQDQIGKIAQDASLFFYLDAHWDHHLPLREVLQLIFNYYTSAVVMIDDFEVKDDIGYGYDDYGHDEALTLDYISGAAVPALSFFFPATASHQETGARRGWVVLVSNPSIAMKLRRMTLLREHSPDRGK